MAKVNIFIEDKADGDLSFQCDIDPPITDENDVTPAQATARNIITQVLLQAAIEEKLTGKPLLHRIECDGKDTLNDFRLRLMDVPGDGKPN